MRRVPACHGADGRGSPPERVGFDVPLPDFTDCSFATREPDGDWFAVAHQGGPVRGFAVTLAIGILTSMFTAIIGTRAVVNSIYGAKRVSRLAI